ncbi:MAG: hypothetical protein HY961_18185 [Ignavibacteriae bacterium]|nr:hypothetical protein [Ignavibacteriota bacterium]
MDLTVRRSASGRWIIGGSLIVVGVVFLLINVGVVDRFPIWRFWPVVLIVLGINKFMQPFHRADGFWLTALGALLLAWFLRVWGFGFPEVIPTFLITIGIFWMWESMEKEARKKNAADQHHNAYPTSAITSDELR